MSKPATTSSSDRDMCSVDNQESETKKLQALRELLQVEMTENGLKCPTDDDFLLRFLRGKKGDVDIAFKVVKAYYRLRESRPELHPKMHPLALADLFASDIYTVLPYRDSEKRHILVFRSRFWNPDIYPIEDVFIAGYLISEELISYEDTQRNGIILIADHGELTYKQMSKIATRMTMKNIRMLIAFYQGAFPARFPLMHIVNHPLVFDLVFKLGMPFMSDKLKKRVLPHGHNVKKLHEYMDSKILPERYEGKIPDSESSDKKFMKKFFERDAYYKEMMQYGYELKNDKK